MLQCLTVETTYFVGALHDLTLLVLYELGVETDPQRFGTIVLMRRIPCFGFGLGHTLTVIVSGRVGHEIDTVLCRHTFGHDSRIEHNRQDGFVVLDTGFLAGFNEPCLVKLRQELIFRIVMVNTVGEPDTFEIFLKERPLAVSS